LGTVLALRLEPSAATETLVSVLIGLAVGLRDLNPRPLLCQLAALRVVGSRPGADA